MADQETSLREDLEAAASEVETEEVVTTDEIQKTAAPEAAEETTEEVSAEVPETDGQPAVAAEPAAPPEAAYNPPVDWPAEVKDQWANLPPNVQAAVAHRERHINETLEQTAGIRHAYDQFNQMLSPFQPLMAAEGVQDPMQAIHGLMTTASQLMVGTPAQKAERVAQLINHYAIDIEMLDQVLAGQPVQNPQNVELENMINQRLAPVDQLLAQFNQSQQAAYQQQEAEAGQNIEQFASDPNNVFFNEVRNTMADFLDMAAAHGQNMTLEEAYTRACLADPNVAPRYTERHAQGAAAGHQQAVAGARGAAASISGKPAGGASGVIDEDMGLRETIAAQFGDSGRI